MSSRTAVESLLVACLLTAGCIGSPDVGPGTETTEVAVDPPPGDADGPITAAWTQDRADCNECLRDGRLAVTDSFDGRTAIALVNADEGMVVLHRTYAGESGHHDLDPVMRTGVAYRVVIWTDGERVWDRPVHDYEGYDLHVESNGSVTVDRLVEV